MGVTSNQPNDNKTYVTEKSLSRLMCLWTTAHSQINCLGVRSECLQQDRFYLPKQIPICAGKIICVSAVKKPKAGSRF